MIRGISQDDIGQCVIVIRESFSTVADEFGFTEGNQSISFYCAHIRTIV